LQGYWYTQRARVAFVTHGLGDLNRLGLPGAFVVYLSHGSPWKKEFLDAPARPLLPTVLRNKMGETLFRRVQLLTRRHFGLIVASSQLSAERFASAYAMPPSRITISGDPRLDNLVNMVNRGEINHPSGTRQILYAPTWRDGADDPAIPSAGDWSALRAVLLAHEACLCIRSHPWGGGDYTKNLQRGDHEAWLRFSTATAEPDVIQLLPDFDILITDYSSVALDFSVLSRPILFFAPDAKEYQASRGLYGNYDEMTGGTAATSWQELCAQLELLLRDPIAREKNVQVSDTIRDNYHPYLDGRSAERVYERVTAGAP
jgi:CDP-glycerol glycerophosphotransferase